MPARHKKWQIAFVTCAVATPATMSNAAGRFGTEQSAAMQETKEKLERLRRMDNFESQDFDPLVSAALATLKCWCSYNCTVQKHSDFDVLLTHV